MTRPTSDHISAFRNRLLSYCLKLALAVGFVALVPSLVISYTTEQWMVFWLDVGAYLCVAVIAVARGLPYVVRAGGFVATLLVTAIGLLAQLGPWGSGIAWLIAAVAFGTLLLGRLGGVTVGLTVGAGTTVLALLLSHGGLDWPIGVAEWSVHMVNVMAATTGVCLATDFLITRIESSFVRRRDYHHVLSRQNRRLRAHSERQTELVRELHHRVKNNLQLLSSLLSLAEGDDGADSVETFRSRVQCLASAHELLHGEGRDGRIDAADLLCEVRDHVPRGSCRVAAYRWCSVESDHIDIDSASAGPLALLVNELLQAWIFVHQELESPADCRLSFVATGSASTLTLDGATEDVLAEAFVERVYGGGAYLVEALVGQVRGSLTVGQGGNAVRVTVTVPRLLAGRAPDDGSEPAGGEDQAHSSGAVPAASPEEETPRDEAAGPPTTESPCERR